VSGGLVIFLVILLYRRIATIGKNFFVVVGWSDANAVVAHLGGVRHFDPKIAFDFRRSVFLSWIGSRDLARRW